MKYTTPAAFRAALDQQLKAEAERTGLNITRLRKRVAFELFLRRLVAVGPGRWVLKGAFSRKETTMTVIDRPWLCRDDDERPRFKTSWHGETRPASARWPGPLPKRQFEAHDPTTRKLIEQYQALYPTRARSRHRAPARRLEVARQDGLSRGETEVPRAAPDADQARAGAKRSDPRIHPLGGEGVRRGVARELLAARTGARRRQALLR